jgi:phosphoenolpyruvate carboxykinase (GTP)
MNIDKSIIDEKSSAKLEALNNTHVVEIVERYAKLCKPAKITVLDDSKEDSEYVKKLTIKNKEESPLAMNGHTFHFDGYNDQARDKANTKVLLPKGVHISKYINTGERESCLKEVFELMDGIMAGKEMLVKFFCLGPVSSKFSIRALQLTDSAYVAHSEDILYRKGYEDFKNLKGSNDFFHFIHSAGEIENGVSKNIDKRRIYMDLQGKRVLTVNNQYAGNSVGLKKLALRLAIKKSHEEDWLCEHMFIIGARPEGKNRVTYFTGAFPSACGKTSTAMIPGQTIIGDDIAYIRPGDDGIAYAVNVEQGIFGIIENVNPVDDPLIYNELTTPKEIIFSNVLVKDGVPYWLGMGKELPEEGVNFSGEWKKGKKDTKGKEIPPAHKNARYTIRISELENADPKLNDANGVPISGFIYGGRDSDTNPPVVQSLSWSHGVFIGAALESETTAATLGQMGVRVHNPMANLDFLTVPLGTYIRNHLKFGEELDKPPKVFATNYFLKENGKFLNEKVDKKVWLMWMEGRIHDEYEAIETPIGFIPKYEDLKNLFRQIFSKDYAKEDYEKQFSIRVTKLLEWLDRIEAIYKEESDVPEVFHDHINQQRERLIEAREKYKKDVISPFEFE